MKTLKPRIATLGASTSPGGWKPDSQRGNRHQRGYGRDWERLRVQVLHRDKGLCQPGLKLGQLHVATQVDHIKGKAEGGADDLANLQAICDPCHRAKTSSESNRGGG